MSGFVKMENVLFRYVHLERFNANTLLVYTFLRSKRWNDETDSRHGTVLMSYQELGAWCGMNERTVRGHMKVLREYNLVAIEPIANIADGITKHVFRVHEPLDEDAFGWKYSHVQDEIEDALRKAHEANEASKKRASEWRREHTPAGALETA